LIPYGFDRARNVLAKVPARAQDEVKDAYWSIFDTDDLDLEPGQQLVDAVQTRIDAFAEHYQRAYPSAVRCLLADRAQLTTYLRFPAEHHHRIRHSNFIERTFGETRRRMKVIGRLPGEASCLSLVWAVLDRASHGWRGVTQTPTGVRLLQDLRRQLLSHPRWRRWSTKLSLLPHRIHQWEPASVTFPPPAGHHLRQSHRS
jgi:putative transposase